jgi:hypothetical protein
MMRRTTREPDREPAASSKLLRSGGVGAALAGLLFVAWGYLDQKNAPPYFYALADVLALIVPALFMVGLAALYARCAGRTAWPAKAGISLGLIGSALGAVKALVKVAAPSLYPHNAPSDRALLLLSVWTPMLFAGLLLAGLALAATRTLRSLGALLLVVGASGWTYYLTDSDAILEARSVHVAFGLLFSLGWVALGLTLWLAEP